MTIKGDKNGGSRDFGCRGAMAWGKVDTGPWSYREKDEASFLSLKNH